MDERRRITLMDFAGNPPGTDEQITRRRRCRCEVQPPPAGMTCAPCNFCGEPGHLTHYPGAVPITAAWCDRCYLVEYREQGIYRRGIEAGL